MNGKELARQLSPTRANRPDAPANPAAARSYSESFGNAHAEVEYVLEPQRQLDQTTPMHEQVRNLVYLSAGSPRNAMSFASAQLDPKRPDDFDPDTFPSILRPSRR